MFSFKNKKSKTKKIRNQNLAILLLLPTATVLHGSAHSDQEGWRDAVAERVWYEHCCFTRWMFFSIVGRVCFAMWMFSDVIYILVMLLNKSKKTLALTFDQFIITIWSKNFVCHCSKTGLNIFSEMFDCSKRPNWSGYFWWHVIINNPSASKDLIEG